jgi:hypothetical protein
MKALSADIGKVITSSYYVLFNSSKGTDHCKAYLLPIDADKVEPSTDGKSVKYTRISTSNDFTVVPMSEELWGAGIKSLDGCIIGFVVLPLFSNVRDS